MRKTSQDGGDTTSITSGIENEIKKSTTGLAKIKRNSIKKKVQGFGHEMDDGVGEPLLQKDKEKSEYQSAKYLLSKNKTDTASEKMDDRDMLLPENYNEKSTFTSFGITGTSMNDTKEGYKPYICTANAIHNHMNVNVFSGSDGIKSPIVPKTQVLVEIDGNKQGSYSSSPLIFTTAKIHTDGKAMHMEPVQVTPVPILSTIEGSIIKTSSISDSERKNIETSAGKDNIKIGSGEISKLGSGVTLPFKVEPVIAGVSKIAPDEIKKPSFSNKISFSSNISNTTTPNSLTSTSVISDTKTLSNILDKDFNSDKLSQKAKEIPKAIDGKSVIITREMDVNKNFQTDPCQSNVNKLVTSSIATKDCSSKHILNTTTPASTTKMLTNTIASSAIIATSSRGISNMPSTTKIGTTLSQIPTMGNVITSVSPVTATIATSNSGQVTTKSELIKGTSVVSNNLGSVKSSSITSNAAPRISQNKEVSKQQESTLPASKAPSVIATTAISIKPSTTTVAASNCSVTPAAKPLSSTTKPTSVAVSSVVSPISIKSKSTASTTSSGITSISGNQYVQSQVSTTITTIPKKTPSSTYKPISTTTSASSTTSMSPSTVNSNIKLPNSTSKNVVTTLISSNKPTSTPSTTTTSFSTKSSTPTTGSELISSGKVLASSKPISTTASSRLATESSSVKPITTPFSAKNISSSTLTTTSSSTAMSSASVTGKLSKTKDATTLDGKALNSAIPTVKPSTVAASKTSQTTSHSQPSVTAAKTAKLDKSANNGTKPGTSAGTVKVTQANLAKVTSQIKDNTRQAPTTTSAATSSQVSKTPAINKPNKLQSNEHKKEKLK